MMADVLAAWSCVLAWWHLGTFALCAFRLWDMWHHTTRRDHIIIIGCGLWAAGWGWHQGLSTYFWFNDLWGWSTTSWHGIGIRAVVSVGVLVVGGALSWPACGHRGWIFLTGSGLFVGLCTYAVQVYAG